MIIRILFTGFLLCVFGSGVALAEEKTKEIPVEPENKQEMMDTLNADIDQQMKVAKEEREEAAKTAYDQIGSLVMKLKQNEQKHFFILYGNYNIVETVKVVKKSIASAVDSCSKNNPDMKEGLDARFKVWGEAVDPLIEEAEGNFNNMVLAQEYVTKEEIDNIFSSVDDAREKSQNQIEKIPVTTPEACQYLKSKMEETEQNMASLLRSTLMSFPKISQEMEGVDLQLPKPEDEQEEKKKENE